jgi:hypothetical protein
MTLAIIDKACSRINKWNYDVCMVARLVVIKSPKKCFCMHTYTTFEYESQNLKLFL